VTPLTVSDRTGRRYRVELPGTLEPDDTATILNGVDLTVEELK